MNLKRVFGLMFIFFVSIVLVACSDDADKEAEDAVASEKTTEEETTEEAKEEEADKEGEAEVAVPEDEELFAVLEANMQALKDKDYDAYMETIHSESPAFEGTREIIEQLEPYTLELELADLKIKDKSEEEASISYKQTSMKVEGPEYMNNETTGVQVLRPDNGTWKIFSTEPIDVVPLDENGEVIEEPEAGGAALEGDYADAVTNLEMPFEDGQWTIGNYQKFEGEALAEFILANEGLQTYSELLSIHYFEGGTEIGTEAFIELMETNLTDITTGTLEFNTIELTEENGLYEFTLSDDETQANQEEVARVFIKDNDLYAVRYTAMEKSIENKDEWIENLKAVK